MTIRLSNHYHSGKFTIGITIDTPTKDNENVLFLHEEITEKKYFEYLNSMEYESVFGAVIVDKVDDGKNIIHTIKEKYITR